jgi:hypothetical protein
VTDLGRLRSAATFVILLGTLTGACVDRAALVDDAKNCEQGEECVGTAWTACHCPELVAESRREEVDETAEWPCIRTVDVQCRLLPEVQCPASARCP